MGEEQQQQFQLKPILRTPNVERNRKEEEDGNTQEPLLGSPPSSARIVIVPTPNKGKSKMTSTTTTTTPSAAEKGQSGKQQLQPSKDICSELMGDFGAWQLRAVLAVYLTKIPAAWYMACIIFTAPLPWRGEVRCNLGDLLNLTDSIGVTHPQKVAANGSRYDDFCTIDLKTLDHRPITSVECEEFIYEIDRGTSLITQFDLLCSKTTLVAITQCFHLFGVLVGGVAATYLMDRWSPRTVMMGGMITSIPCGLATGHVPWFWLHVAFRCLVAACAAAAFTPGGAIMADVVGGRKKILVMGNFEHYWSIGVILLSLIGFYVKTWSEIYITITLPMIIIMFLWIWIPDSPRWHLLKGNNDKVQMILEEAVRVNGSKVDIPDDLHEIIREQSEAAQVSKMKMAPQDNWSHLLSIEGMTLKIFFLFTAWSLMLTCYYGTLLNIRSFGRQYLYVTTVIAGVCEIVGGFIGFQVLYNCHQKWKILGVLTSFTGVVTCFIWFMPTHIDGSHMLSNLLVISMINKIGISATLSLLLTCTGDLVPLPHKKRVVFGATVMGRIVFITAPLIGATVQFGDGVPLTFFGILTVIGGMSTVALKPEKNATNNLKVVADPKVWTVNNENGTTPTTTTKL